MSEECEHARGPEEYCDACARSDEESELAAPKGVSARSSGEAILRLWWLKMPNWAKEAYHQDPAMHRVIIECSIRETSEAEMLWEIISALYEQRNQWRETALHLKQYEPLKMDT